jgi:hypothetical protein
MAILVGLAGCRSDGKISENTPAGESPSPGSDTVQQLLDRMTDASLTNDERSSVMTQTDLAMDFGALDELLATIDGRITVEVDRVNRLGAEAWEFNATLSLPSADSSDPPSELGEWPLTLHWATPDTPKLGAVSVCAMVFTFGVECTVTS